MGSIVSSRLDFINKNPTKQVSYDEVRHELQHLKKREQVSSIVAVGGIILTMLALAGVIGGGHIIIGALLAIALFAGAYAYCCRLAEESINKHMSTWIVGAPTDQIQAAQDTESARTRLLGFFSKDLEAGTKAAKKPPAVVDHEEAV